MNHPRIALASILLATLISSAHAQADFVASFRPLPPTVYESSAKPKLASVIADRKIYWNDDPVGQFLVSFLGQDLAGRVLRIQLLDAQGKALATQDLGALKEPKVVLLLKVGALKPGAYKLKASLEGGATPLAAERDFQRADAAHPRIAIPREGIRIELEPQKEMPDAAWPMTAGVAFPSGTLTDAGSLALFEGDKEVPAEVQVTETWHPAYPGFTPSARWAHVRFLGRYEKGQPKSYALRTAPQPSVTQIPRATATAQGDLILVDTGVMRFTVNRKKFSGFEAAWVDLNGDRKYVDDELVIGPKGGAYLVDCRSTEFLASDDAQAQVVVEEAGPFQVTLRAEGWYTNSKLSDVAGRQLCLFHTRMTAWAGQPTIRVQHRTIITYDSDTNRLLDLGFRLPAPNATGWRMGVDGKAVSGKTPAKDKTVFLHQYRWNKLRVVGLEKDEKGQKVPMEFTGARSDGWFTLAGDRTAMTVVLRDIWQKFPKEAEIADDGLTLHFWPKHGMRTFTSEEMLKHENIYKLWFMHHGSLMDLRFPSDAYDALKEMDEKSHWDPEHTREFALCGNAQGVAVGNEFFIRLHPAKEDASAWGALAQHDPIARADPEWNVRTGVEGRLAPRDEKTFPEVEKDLDTFMTDYMRVVVDGGTEYGMWIYADTHNNWDIANNRAFLHRVWQNSHYRHAWTPWFFLFRGAPFDVVRWARAQSDRYQDIGTVNYADPKAPLKGHVPGAMYHAKQFTPWGSPRYGQKIFDSYLYIWGHWIGPDAFLMRHRMEGNARARDLYAMWIASVKTANIPTGAGREVGNTSGELINAYRATWDPDLIPILDGMADGMLTPKLTEWPHAYGFPVFNPFWFGRFQDFTRDPRIVPALKEYAESYGQRNEMVAAFCYQMTGDKKYLTPEINGSIYDYTRCIYRNPGDRADGYRLGFGTTQQWSYQMRPYYLQALKDAGVTALDPGPKSGVYPSRASHPQYIPGEAPALEVMALDPDDREFSIRFESLPGYDVYNPYLRVIAPSGKIVLEKTLDRPASSRYLGNDIVTLKAPKDGERGLYKIDCRSWEGMFFRTPYTDLPLEGVVIAPGAPCNARGRQQVYLVPVGIRGPLRFEFSGDWRYDTSNTAYARIEDANGKLLFETTVVAGTQRPKAAFEVPAAAPAPWKLYTFSSFGPNYQWTGEARALVGALTPETAKKLAQEVEKMPPPAPK